jgi:hypothetical protein
MNVRAWFLCDFSKRAANEQIKLILWTIRLFCVKRNTSVEICSGGADETQRLWDLVFSY